MITTARESVREAVRREYSRTFPGYVAAPWPDDLPWEPLSPPEPCERCGTRVFAVEHRDLGRHVIQIDRLARPDNDGIIAYAARHTTSVCAAAREALL